MKSNQKGFALQAGLLIVLILAVVGFGGYYVWHHQKQTSKSNSNASALGDSPLSPNYSPTPVSADCKKPAQDLKVKGDVTVSRVDTATKTIYFDANNQYVYDSSVGSNTPTISSRLYSDSTIFCAGKNLTRTSISAIKAGNQITIYLKSAGDTTLSQVSTTYLLN